VSSACDHQPRGLDHGGRSERFRRHCRSGIGEPGKECLEGLAIRRSPVATVDAPRCRWRDRVGVHLRYSFEIVTRRARLEHSNARGAPRDVGASCRAIPKCVPTDVSGDIMEAARRPWAAAFGISSGGVSGPPPRPRRIRFHHFPGREVDGHRERRQHHELARTSRRTFGEIRGEPNVFQDDPSAGEDDEPRTWTQWWRRRTQPNDSCSPMLVKSL